MHLTTTQHGAYILLIMAYWERKKALPADHKQLASISKLTQEEWEANSHIIADFFDTDSDSTLWIHPKIEELIKRSEEIRRQASEKGKKGAKAKWQRP